MGFWWNFSLFFWEFCVNAGGSFGGIGGILWKTSETLDVKVSHFPDVRSEYNKIKQKLNQKQLKHVNIQLKQWKNYFSMIIYFKINYKSAKWTFVVDSKAPSEVIWKYLILYPFFRESGMSHRPKTQKMSLSDKFQVRCK